MRIIFIMKAFLILLIIFSGLFQIGQGVFYQTSTGENLKSFISNPQPNINMTLTSDSNRMLSIDSILYNGVQENYSFLPINIEPYQTQQISFEFPSNLIDELEQNPVEVFVNINPSVGSQEEIQTEGSPTRFDLEYINSTQVTHYSTENTNLISLTNNISLGDETKNLVFHLNNKIVSYNVEIDSEVENSQEFTSDNLEEIPSAINVSVDNLEKGTYDVDLFYTDIAGNTNTQNLKLDITNPKIEIIKVYSKKDSSQDYNYYYNSIFNESVIYTDTSSFDLEFKTNINATCYIRELTTFRDTVNADSVTNQTQNHKIPITIENSKKSGIWVMCEDASANAQDNSRTYLSEKLFNKKTLFEVNLLSSQDDFEITTASPNNLVTSSPVTLEANTNYKSFCNYNIEETSENSTMNNVDDTFLKHRVGDILPDNDGNFDITIQCFDQLYNEDSTILNLDIDTKEPTQLISWSPELSINEFVDLEIETSDPNALCSIPRNSESAQDNLLNQEEDITPDSTQGSTLYFDDFGPFTIHQEYSFILECANREGVISRPTFNITYDPVGPSITSVDLFNEEFGPTEFFSKSDYMKLEVESDSSSVQYYTVEFENSNILINSSSSSVEVEDNFSQDTSVKILATDNLGRESNSFTENFQYDTQAPTLSIQTGSSSSKKEVVCSDSESSCAQISYGTSSIESSCLAKTSYDEGDEIDIFGKNYLCVEAIDEAGNRANVTEQVSSTSSGPFNPSVNDTDDDSENGSEDPTFENPPLNNNNNNSENEGRNGSENESEDPLIDPAEPADPVEEDEFNWLLLSAFAFILLATGGSGYYAYRKGYLDQQLAKMGIATKKKSSTPSNSTTPNYSSIPRKELDKNKFQSAAAQDNSNQSKYDSHINKLNSFINSTLNKDSAMFDEFEKKREKTSQDKNNLKETLIKNKAKENDEKDSFEKFHKNMNSQSEDTSNKKSN